jgi:tetratricopeptide (TPR) repeat protein
VLFQLGILREFQARWTDAEAFHQEAAAIRTEALGPHHRDTVSALAKAALNRVRRLPPDEAEALLSRTLEDLRRFMAPDHYLTRATMNLLGERLLNRGKFNEALDLFEQTYQMAVADEGRFSSDALWARELTGLTHARQGRFADAEKTFLEVIAARTQVSGPDHYFTLQTQLLYVDQVLVPQRRFAEAAPMLLRAERIVRSNQPQLQAGFEKAVEATLVAWESQGGGPEFESFRRQVMASAPSGRSGGDAPVVPRKSVD